MTKPYASVDFLKSTHHKPIETIIQGLIGKQDQWQDERDEDEEGYPTVVAGATFRILSAWVNHDFEPEQFPSGYVFVDTEEF